MNVICPKCQSENQVNPSSQGAIRVVCARCATIFEAKFTQGAAPGSSLGQPSMPPLAASASSSPGRDTYATRVEPDFDEVLDIPLAGQADYQTNEPAPVFEDVFTTAADDLAPPVSLPPPPPDPRVTIPLPRPEPLIEPQAETQFSDQFAPQFDSRFDSPYDVQPKPEEVEEAFAPPESEQNGHMPPPALTSWPVLSGDREDFNTPPKTTDSATKSSSVFMRVALMILVFGALGAVALYFLRDKLPQSNQNNVGTDQSSANNQNAGRPGATSAPSAPGSGTASETKPATVPTAAPTESKPAVANETKATEKPAGQEVAKKTEPEAAKKESASAAASASPKAAPSQTAKPAVENKKQNAVKPAPPDASFGHSVKPNEGSITVQVASFNNQALADERAASLKSAGVEAHVVKADIPGKGTWYRVQVGRFTTREEALRYANQLKARGVVKDAIPTPYQGR